MALKPKPSSGESLIVSGSRKDWSAPKQSGIPESRPDPSYRPTKLQLALEEMRTVEEELGMPPVHASIANLIYEQTPLAEEAARRHGSVPIEKLVSATTLLLENFDIAAMSKTQREKLNFALESLKEASHVGIATEKFRQRMFMEIV